MTLNNQNSMEVVMNNVERETEKAILVNMPVYWNGGSEKNRSFWFPKSCVEVCKQTIVVTNFLIEKLMKENSFHGYDMRFVH